MNRFYRDILSRVSDPVLWFDECAVPRFDPFEPGRVANIYAEEVALVRIECQGCGHPFDVAFTSAAASEPLPKEEREDRRYPILRDYILAGELHYGDPPNIECCAAGPSMNSVPRHVIEYWVKPFVLGEGVGCRWPPPPVSGDVITPEKSMRLILAPGVTQFRRDRHLEGREIERKPNLER